MVLIYGRESRTEMNSFPETIPQRPDPVAGNQKVK